MEKSISVIIPVWNDELIIRKMFKYLQKLELPFEYSELIFIAGGTDKTYEICNSAVLDNFSKVITLKQFPGDYKSGALIKGLKEAKGDYFVLLDADTIVLPNFAIEIVKALKENDIVNCDYYPLIKKGFWYNFYIINKKIWAKNPKNLPNLFGGATISLKKNIINELGVESLFTDKTTAGVDHYMGEILKKNNKELTFVDNTRVYTLRPNGIREFSKDRLRWLSAFFTLYQDEKLNILNNLILSAGFLTFPPLLLLFIIKKTLNLSWGHYPKFKLIITYFLVEFLVSFLRIIVIISKITRKLKPIEHFKGIRY